MPHPFLSTLRGKIILPVVWLVMIAIHTAILIFTFNINLSNALMDGFTTNTIWALLSFGLWFWVRFTDMESGKVLTLALNHAGAMALSVLVQVFLTISILKAYDPTDSLYSQFVEKSAMGRTIYGIALYLILALIFYLYIYIQGFREKLVNEGELKALIKDAELNWLKLQVSPHFLFNSLNSVSSLTLSEPLKAQEMIIRLSELLRYSLAQTPSSMVPLEKEIENCLAYLEIERIRFGPKLVYRFQVAPEHKSTLVPGMIIQPLFENAIKHGVSQTPEETHIEAHFSRSAQGLTIEISNTLPSDPFLISGTGVGLENIRRRLKLIYGSESLVSTTQTEKNFSVKILIPTPSI